MPYAGIIESLHAASAEAVEAGEDSDGCGACAADPENEAGGGEEGGGDEGVEGAELEPGVKLGFLLWGLGVFLERRGFWKVWMR